MFVLLALAAYRVQRLVTADEFPLSKKLREWVHDRFGAASWQTTFVRCHWCAGGWISSAVVLAWDWWGSAPSLGPAGVKGTALRVLATTVVVGALGEAIDRH